MAPDERSKYDRDQGMASAIVTTAAGFFWQNRLYVLRDLLFALLWVAVISAVFVVSPLPGWLYYVLLFGGLLCYSMVVSLLGTAAKLQR